MNYTISSAHLHKEALMSASLLNLELRYPFPGTTITS